MEIRSCAGAKDVTEFNYRVKAEGSRQRYCRACTRLQVKAHYEKNRAYYLKKTRDRLRELEPRQRAQMLAYLALHPCVDCGESDPVCLEFDHVRGRKVDAVSRMVGKYEWATIEKEMAKCEVRCANRHKRRTARQRGCYKLLGTVLRP